MTITQKFLQGYSVSLPIPSCWWYGGNIDKFSHRARIKAVLMHTVSHQLPLDHAFSHVAWKAGDIIGWSDSSWTSFSCGFCIHDKMEPGSLPLHPSVRESQAQVIGLTERVLEAFNPTNPIPLVMKTQWEETNCLILCTFPKSPLLSHLLAQHRPYKRSWIPTWIFPAIIHTFIPSIDSGSKKIPAMLVRRGEGFISKMFAGYKRQ